MMMFLYACRLIIPQLARNVHAKCSVLSSALSLIGCPIKLVARALEGAPVTQGGLEKLQPIDKVET